MNNLEAEKIVQEYKLAIGKGPVGETILRKASLLSSSKAKIKYAYFVIIEDIIARNGKMPVGLRSELVEDYKQLNTFVMDNIAENFAKKQEIWQEKKSDPVVSQKYKSSIREYIGYTHFIQNDNLFDEINEYIEELLRRFL